MLRSDTPLKHIKKTFFFQLSVKILQRTARLSSRLCQKFNQQRMTINGPNNVLGGIFLCPIFVIVIVFIEHGNSWVFVKHIEFNNWESRVNCSGRNHDMCPQRIKSI